MQSFQRLGVWQRAHRVTLIVYRASASFPQCESYGLTSQLRRSAGSIGANLAEGCGRGSDADFRRCLYVALGSLCETENHVIVARDLGYLESGVADALAIEVTQLRRMLIGLIKRLSKRT